MESADPRPFVQVGDPAPDFTLPSASSDRAVALTDYREKSPLLLCIHRGLYCPFCRRALVQLGTTSDRLHELGVETLAVVSTAPERARMYLRLRPTRVDVAADPDRATHRAYGLPNPPVTPELAGAHGSTRVNPTGELPEAVPLTQIISALNEHDGVKLEPADQRDMESQMPQLAGQFLIDMDGIVRWANVEAAGGLGEVGKFPTDDELITAVHQNLRA